LLAEPGVKGGGLFHRECFAGERAGRGIASALAGNRRGSVRNVNDARLRINAAP
jgi:hypothetical protein